MLHSFRPGHEQHGDVVSAGSTRSARLKLMCGTGPMVAAGQLPASSRRAAGPRAQRRHHAMGLLRSEARCTKSRRPRNASRPQRQRPDLRRGRDPTDLVRPRSGKHMASTITCRCAIRRRCRPRTTRCRRALRGEEVMDGPEPRRKTRRTTRRAAFGRPRASARPRILRLLFEEAGASLREGLPARASTPASADGRAEDRQATTSSAPALETPDHRSQKDANNMLVAEPGRAGSGRGGLARPEGVRRDRRRGEGQAGR